MPSLLKLRKFTRSPNKVTTNTTPSNSEPPAPSPMFQCGKYENSPIIATNFESNSDLCNNSGFSYRGDEASGESSPETPRPSYQNGMSTMQSSCYDDDILFQVEVNATGVETYATSTVNPPSSNGSSSQRHWHRKPPPSSNSSSDSYQQLLSSSFDKYSHGQGKPATHQFRALTPPSSLFHKQSSSSHHRPPNISGLTVQPVNRPYSIAGQVGGPANQNALLPSYQECVLSSAPCNSAATTPGNNTELSTPAAPPPSIVTGPPTCNSSNKVILYPYVFRPVRPSKSSGQISSALPVTPSSRSGGPSNNDIPTLASTVSPGANGFHAQRPLSSTELHYPALNGGNNSARKQKMHSNKHSSSSGMNCDPQADSLQHSEQLMTTSLQLPLMSASGAHCRTECPSINSSIYSNSGMMDLETQLRWKDTELKQLRSTMQNNESAMTKLLDETAQEYERKLNAERQKVSRLEAALKNKGPVSRHDISVQTSTEDIHPPYLFENERAKWLEEKAKVISYQRQIQLSYLQLVRKCQRLENDIEQLNKELEEKDKQLLVTSGFNQLNIDQLHHFTSQPFQQQQSATNNLYQNGMKRSASSDDKMSMFLHLDPEETAC